MRLVLHTDLQLQHYPTIIMRLHDRPFSVTSEDSLRDSEPPDITGDLSTKGQDTSCGLSE